MDTFINKLNNIQSKALSYDFSNDERRFVCIRLTGANGTGFLSEIEKHLSENPNSLVAGVFQQLLKQAEQK